MGSVIWLGLDVHAQSIAISKYKGASKNGARSEIPNDPKVIRRTVERFRREGKLRCCYEAGPCGFELYRQLDSMGIDCTVVAPSLIPRKPGDRVKTDARDADKLARLFRAGELTAVHVPTPEQEAARNLMRAREDLRRDRIAARLRFNQFLLRYGHRYKGTRWTLKYWAWVRGFDFEGPDKIAFTHYSDHILYLDQRMESLTKGIHALAATPAFKARVERFCCLRGVSVQTAMVLITELHDLRRFTNPRHLMAYVGLVPSEHSSGARQRRGGITKTGNTHVRRVLVEAAWSYRYKPYAGPRLRKALKDQPAEVAALSHKAMHRLSGRYTKLRQKKSSQLACVSVARELCGFLWALERIPMAT